MTPPAAPGESLVDVLRDELAPRPGRLGDVARITALTLLVVVVAETFHIPLPAYSAYIVFFASKEETASTTLTGVVLTLAATVAVLSALLVYTVTAGEPGLRLPMMAAVAFTGVFLSRISSLGPAAFAAGFVMTVSLTLIDVVPPAAPLPPAEILTQTVLWLWVVVMLPIGLVVLVNLLTGRDPDELFRQALADRLDSAGRAVLGGDAGRGRRSAAVLRRGLAAPLRHLKLAGLLHRRTGGAIDRALVAATHDALALAVEWQAAARPATDETRRLGAGLLAAARALRDPASPFPAADEPAAAGPVDPAATLLLVRLATVLARLCRLLADRRAAAPAEAGPGAEPAARRLFVADAWSNPQHVRFALKTTLAVMLAYLAYNLLDWPDIRTAMITCFFVTFGDIGETVHRMTLRLAGALIGGGLGLAAVIFVMPWLTSIVDLCLLIGVVAFAAGWVATSSDRLAYAGMQIALAFFLCVLVGYGPHVDLATARDRVVGILLGNVIVSLVFATLWPVSAIALARTAWTEAIARLGEILRAPSEAALFAFDDALARTRRFLSFDPFEPAPLKGGGIAAGDPDLAQALLRPVLVLTDGAPPAAPDYRNALGDWLAGLAAGMAAPDAAAALPPPPALPPVAEAAQAAWYAELDRRARRLDATIRLRLAEQKATTA